jgi:cellulose synthase/poly-beta-1,6-N-acetylglucosamine synthase-like glycosyltransferase
MKVAIIILNFNGWKDTIECLESLQKIDYPDYLMVVVYNDSSDGSIEKIKSWAEGKVKVVEYEKEIAEQGGIKKLEEELQKYSNDKKIGLIKGTISFLDESKLFFTEYLDLRYKIEKLTYSFHYQSKKGELIFRYDNARHKPDLKFREHKHIKASVIQCDSPKKLKQTQ